MFRNSLSKFQMIKPLPVGYLFLSEIQLMLVHHFGQTEISLTTVSMVHRRWIPITFVTPDISSTVTMRLFVGLSEIS